MIFNKSEKIQFVSTVKGLESIEECLPKPAKHFIPKWFKDIPSKDPMTVKECPSFPDYFSQGYIVPMWCDVKLRFDGKDWSWETPSKNFFWSIHPNEQFLNYTKANFSGVDAHFVFKADCPWRIITPPGWSVLQLPLFYHFNKQWSVLPGVIDTDIHHEINQQILYHGDQNEILIKNGEPLVLYIPFKRSDKLKHEITYQTEEQNFKFYKDSMILHQEFPSSGVYRKLQRNRDKGV